ncbi:MAG TPA: PHB depolymerase family esterase [Burkholderiales bacterium]|nr:PHB depolymerase family esterase [Burkholderiales bacterium]
MRASTLLLGLLASGLVQAAGLAPGDYEFAVHAGGLERRYLVHTPLARRALPAVVLNFHGGGGNAEAQRGYSHMDALADREGFVAVYPFGTGRLKSKLLTWNAGSCCGSAARDKVDDVGFVAALLDDLAARTPYDRTRVYATGLSNGAMMAYRLAASLPERIAAIAPVAGIVAPGAAAARRAVPVMHIHSVDDPRALYQGGLGPPFPFTNARVQHAPVEATLAQWVEFEGCRGTPELAEQRQWRAPEETHTAERLVFSGCRDGAEVVLWKLTGAGHVWPGGTRDYLTRWLGPSTRVIDANEEMWRFFRRFAVGLANR